MSEKKWSRRLIDLTGKRFGALTVVGRSPVSGRRVAWQCRCDCGQDRTALSQNLSGGFTKSCGCGIVGRKWESRGGKSATRLYSIWRGMRERCAGNYPAYGGRGITVCAEWSDFAAFAAWAEANGYADDLTLDRKDNDLGYSPCNCRWTTPKEQRRHKRNTRWFVVANERLTLGEACRKYGLLPETVRQRIARGWSYADLFKPIAGDSRLLQTS